MRRPRCSLLVLALMLVATISVALCAAACTESYVPTTARTYTPTSYYSAPSTQQTTPSTQRATPTTERVQGGTGDSRLDGTTWKGTVALTMVTVIFKPGGLYSSAEFGSGAYFVDGNQVILKPANGAPTRVFIWEGSLMQGVIDGWNCVLTKQY